MGDRYFHSVTLHKERCMGCTNCIKRCPTEAIRVRDGKAFIIKERCIDCGECIRICPYRAKKAVTDPFSSIYNYKYKVAIPAPSFIGQFSPEHPREKLLAALKNTGFDEVFEVAAAAEIISEATKKLLLDNKSPRPVISSACPAVIRLIQVRFPNLIDNVLKLEAPMETAAKIARRRVKALYGLKDEEIGVFFITPCAAKVTSVKAPLTNARSAVSGVISISDIFVKVLSTLNKTDSSRPDGESLAGYIGVRWASSGGESLALDTDKYLAVDGIHNVASILEEVENDRLEDVDFIEALACTGGCIGGPLTVENVYVAKSRMNKRVEEAKKLKEGIMGSCAPQADIPPVKDLMWTEGIKYNPAMVLDGNLSIAMVKLDKLEKIKNCLPGLDCGACGSPSCRALAEDIVRGKASETDCIFILRERFKESGVNIENKY